MQESLLHFRRRRWLQGVPKCLGIFYTHVRRNNIPHYLSLIQLALNWKHPSPCVRCEKFLGFVSWIFHGKQNSIFFFFNRRAFEMSWTCFGYFIGSVFCNVASHPPVLSSKPQILQPLGCSVPWFDNPAIGGWSGRKASYLCFSGSPQHPGGLLGCPTSSLWKIVCPI